MKKNQLNTAIQELLEGIISEADLELLQDELKTSEEARSLYLDSAEIHSLLAQTEQAVAHLPKNIVPMERIVRRQRRKTVRIAAIATAAVLLIGLITMSLFFIDPAQPTLTFQTSPGTQYTLTHSSKNEAPKGLVLEKGSRLQLIQGSVELTFNSGVTSVIMAPADLTLREDEVLFLNKGTAWFDVPEEAIGFTVKTKDLNIVDLGTEFGVLARKNDYNEVHVFKGKVRASALYNRKESATLSAGQARRIDSIGRLSAIPENPSAFLTSLPDSLPYLHWSFDGEKGYQASGTLPQASEIQTTSLSSPKLVPGKKGSALSLNGNGQHLITDWSGFSGNRPRTVSFWLRLPENATQSFLPGIVAWGDRATHLGKWKIAISDDSPTKKSHLRLSWGDVWMTSKKPLAKEEWIHVLVTSTGMLNEQGLPTADIYINGQLTKTKYGTQRNGLLQSKLGTITSSQSAVPVMIGSDLFDKGNDRNTLHAQIDELYIIDGAINEQQAQQWKNLSVKDQ